MKKVLKLLVAIIFAIAIIGGVMFLVDCSTIKSGKEPVFAREIGVLNDGGTIEYMGLGYKIIDFNRLNGYSETKVGLWYIKYEDYEEEYKKLDKDILDDINKDNEDVSEDNYEIITSGDLENQNNEVASGEVINNNVISGDLNNVSGEIADVENKEDGYYFNATIIGINNNNLVVQALEDELINLSSDMFSFSLPKTEGNAYLIGQKVRIKYTGTIRETYPAQIDALEIEIIE